VLRYALSPRFIAWHLCCLVLVGLLIAAGVWQWGVATSEIGADGEPVINIRNLVYACQWWVFAAFAIWFWFRFLRDQRDADHEEMLTAVNDAPDQQGMKAAAPSVAPTETLISLDDSASARRARARQGLAGDSSEPGTGTAGSDQSER
jgi:hypothetical protein